MADLETYIPKGYTAGRPPMISELLSARLERLPRRAGPQRLLVLAAAGVKGGDLDAFLHENALWNARLKAPGVYSVEVLPDDIARFTARKDLFSWIDAGTRLFGEAVPAGAASAVIEVAVGEDAALAERRLKGAGGTVTARTKDIITAKVPAAKIADLLRAKGIEAIEVKSAE